MEEGTEGPPVAANETAALTDMATALPKTSAEPKKSIIGKVLGLLGGNKQKQASPSAPGSEVVMGQGPAAITPEEIQGTQFRTPPDSGAQPAPAEGDAVVASDPTPVVGSGIKAPIVGDSSSLSSATEEKEAA